MSNSKMSADDLPVEYRHSGTTGHALSTVAGKISALVHFNEFLATKRMKPFDDLSESDLCSVGLFQQYGTYISEHAKNKKKGDDLLMWGTAKQFISGAKASAEAKFPANAIWVSQVWYTKIRYDIQKTIGNRCIELGIPVEDKSEPVGREL